MQYKFKNFEVHNLGLNEIIYWQVSTEEKILISPVLVLSIKYKKVWELLANSKLKKVEG